MSAAPQLQVEEPEALQAALTYAKRGWPVAPAHAIDMSSTPDDLGYACTCTNKKCTSRGKHPLTTHGLKDASIDEVVIRKWWAQWPHANVLIRTGLVGGRCLIAIDVDPRHNGDESLAEVIARHGELPPTPMTCTGGGGQHIFLWAAREVPNSAGKENDGRFGEGVDIRGEGGYVIAAPSRHSSGRTYEWDSGAHPADIALAEAPQWLVELACKSKKRLEVNDHAIQGDYLIGGRNDALARLGGAMRRVGAGLKSIERALLDENADRCRPPLDYAEVRGIARSVYKYPPGDPSIAGVDPLPMLSGVDLATEMPPIPWVVEGLAWASGAPIILGGLGGGGKTMMLQSALMSIALGLPVWGQFAARQGRVVHLDYEQGRRTTQWRYQRILRGMGRDPREVDIGWACLPSLTLDADQAEEHLVRACYGATVAIVDSNRAAFPNADENSSKSRENMSRLQRVSERTGCAMIVIAHSRKPNGTDADSVQFALRGSGALYDASQAVYMLCGEGDLPPKCHMTKHRETRKAVPTFGLAIEDVPVDGVIRDDGPLVVRYIDPIEIGAMYAEAKVRADSGEDVMAASAERLSTHGARLMAIIGNAGETGASEAMLRAATKSTKLDADAVLGALLDQGAVRCEGRRGDARWWLVRS
jgi:hypothetical protein